MKKTLLPLAAICAMTLCAAPEIRRADILPGTATVPQARYEKFSLSDANVKSGTLSMWIRPEGWSNDDKAWHFFCHQTSGSKQMMLYRFPNGKTRLLFKTDGVNAAEIMADIPFENGKWTHLAFTWECNQKRNISNFVLYVDGKKVKTRFSKFILSALPEEIRVGDIPLWNPKSKFTSSLGKVELHDRALNNTEIATLAQEKK